MDERSDREYLPLLHEEELAFIDAARNDKPVSGLTHDFYKYPARFSPVFARAAIEIFTRPGHLVLDPHVGGGTALVEAIASGRRAIGVDISTLAEFVSTVKATVFSETELNRLESWRAGVRGAIDIRRPSARFTNYEALGYYKHLNCSSRWRLRKGIEQGIEFAIRLGDPRLEAFGRCVVLRAGQWALDGRRKQATIEEFRAALEEYAIGMIRGARELRAAVRSNGRSSVMVLRRSAAGIESDQAMKALPAPRLVITSPPYPGVHILYHRWQVDGRKEAPLPFLIASKLDGAGSSYYTMGDRKYPGLETYFENIRATMSSVTKVADRRTIVVQMLAFSEPSWQLPRYLETMEEAGLVELHLASLQNEGDGRLWRSVPNRRWYSNQLGKTPGSHEVVLFHRKATNNTRPPLAASVRVSSTVGR